MKAKTTSFCRRCNHAMETVTNVAPSRRDPGLIVWYCPNCNAADSELVLAAERAPTGPDAGPQGSYS